MRKILTVLAIMILVLAVAGCASDTENKPFDATFDMTETGKTDLQGLNFNVTTHWVEEWHPNYGDSSYGDNMLKRYDDAMHDLNISISFTHVVDEPKWLYMDLAAGLDVPDCLDNGGQVGYDWYKANILMPLSGISTIDYTDRKFGPFKYIRYGIFSDGQPYGFFPWYWENLPQFSGVLLFNNVLQRAGGIRDPYELQENGKWNWEEFEELLKTCDKAFSGEEISIFPLDAGLSACAKNAIFANGLDIVVKNGPGYGTDLLSEPAYAALEYVAELNREGLIIQGSVDDFTVSQRAVFYLGETWVGTLFTNQVPSTAPNQMEEFGMMPFPFGPNGTPETTSAYVQLGRRLFWTCALSDNDTDDLGIIYNYLFEPFSDSYTYDTGWKDIAKTNVFHHKQDLENFIYMIENIRYDYSTQLQGITPVYDAMEEVALGTKSAASAMESVSSILMSEIESNVTWGSDEIAW